MTFLWLKKERPFDRVEAVLINLLNGIGEAILPRIAANKNIKRILLIPHKLLYLLPLHAMVNLTHGNMNILEQFGPVTYSSSLCMYAFRGKFGKIKKDSKKIFFAFLYLSNLNINANLELEYYKALFGDDGSFDIVSEVSKIPKDLSIYPFLTWSSHGYSDPSDWTKSYLSFGDKNYTAKEIIANWNLRHAFVANLSACETGTDKSINDAIDEYFGLDMAVHIAGAETVLSTMWPVEENLAGLISFSFCEGIIKHQEKPSGYLRELRYDLLSGRWRDKAEINYKKFKSMPSLSLDEKKRYSMIFERILENSKDAFSDVNSWAVYRTFGSW